MNRPAEEPAHVSLFPLPPWQLINKYSDAEVAAGTAPPPPQIPASTSFRMFGTLFNTDDPVLKPLESDGMRRVYPQTYNRKLELKKLNFSILANYLDLLDVITRDPSSPRRTEKLEHLGILFVNMHHILNEYHPHQARDLEMLRYQVDIARETVRRGREYFARADETLRTAAQQLVVPGPSSASKSSSSTSPSFADLGDLYVYVDAEENITDVTTTVQISIGTDEAPCKAPNFCWQLVSRRQYAIIGGRLTGENAAAIFYPVDRRRQPVALVYKKMAGVGGGELFCDACLNNARKV
ncbi:unnamed protein product [Dibothriocephalus latus]|uniref:Mediator of RNA polymerase II transcription subunit 7 n=1 Tax=Dibothriocephalus latus TaxID=60516 RepID=A0A3P7P7L8_DIBLA|nr:unnamed protein product [Dibothriocephalus latus]